MSTPLLATKLYGPPLTPDLVPRVRLVRRLDEGLRLGRPLTLVSAPAGYGKTTLVVQWLQSADRAATWLSLDEGDNDPARFLTYLIAALQRVDQGIGGMVQTALEGADLPPIETLVTALINDVAATPTSFLLLLDDYHAIREAQVHETIRFLLERQPPQMHVVIMTREDPPLPLPRLRLGRRITEIRERDLRFTPEEAGAFLSHTMDLTVSSEAVAALEEHTEGWIAGLQFAAVSLRDREDVQAFARAFRGDDRYVSDYLIQEVLQRQPVSVQEFLLRTSILTRFSVSLCDALILEPSPTHEVGSSQEIIEHLDAANVFIIPLDNRREWYRYHHLFSDLLRQRLRREHPQQIPELYRRASRWFETESLVEEAMDHALAIPDPSLVADIAQQHVMRVVRAGRLGTCLRLMRRLPEEEIHARPYLCAGIGWVHCFSEAPREAQRIAQAGEAALADFEGLYLASEGRAISRREVEAEFIAIRGYCEGYLGDLRGAEKRLEHALELLPEEADGSRCAMLWVLASIHAASGRDDQADAMFREAFEMATGSGQNVCVALGALNWRAWIAQRQGRLDDETRFCQQAIALAGERVVGGTSYVCQACKWLGEAHRCRNQLAEATSWMERAVELAELGDLPSAQSR